MSAADPGAALAALGRAGAQRFDAVRFHHLAALARRAPQERGGVGRWLAARLDAALAAFAQDFARAQADARALIARSLPRHPSAAAELERLFAAGDFGGVARRAAALEREARRPALAGLARHAERDAPRGDGPAPWPQTHPELKAVRHFRSTWSKLSVERRVAAALGQAPAQAGPLNSHFLVLRSLEMMRAISPDYLGRFMSYVDTLLRLEQAHGKPAAKKPAKPRAGRR